MKLRADTYLYDTVEASDETGIDCSGDPGRTQQHFKEECDINTIVERFGLSGQLPQNVRVPLEAEFVEAFDFQTAMNAIRRAEESFMQMPAKVRARFSNDPGAFVDFCSDEANKEEMRSLGLLVEKLAEPPADTGTT